MAEGLKTASDKIQAGVLAGIPPPLHSVKTRSFNLSLPVTVISVTNKLGNSNLSVGTRDFVDLIQSVQLPLGNYNYDTPIIAALNKPNELTISSGSGVDIYALAAAKFGANSVAAIELICYNGFTSNVTGAGQGLLMIPPDESIANALSSGSAIYVCYATPVIIALRQSGQSSAESAAGVLAINIILK